MAVFLLLRLSITAGNEARWHFWRLQCHFLQIVSQFRTLSRHSQTSIGSDGAVIRVCLHSGLTYGSFRRLAPPSSSAWISQILPPSEIAYVFSRKCLSLRRHPRLAMAEIRGLREDGTPILRSTQDVAFSDLSELSEWNCNFVDAIMVRVCVRECEKESWKECELMRDLTLM